MKRVGLVKLCLLLLSFSVPWVAGAAEEGANVYGWELMTPQERQQHREKMQSLKTEQEREKYRMEHHERMSERARQQGRTLPDMPREKGSGMGDGMGSGKNR